MRKIGAHKERERSKISNLWRLQNFIDKRCLAPATHDGDGEFNGLRRRPYRLLPQQELIHLFVLKLDGSVFDVHVARNSTVADLKRAIEEVFNSPEDENCSISWSLVWGHFCLCYEGQMLSDDKACIRGFGIKDGDQLQFIRHMSISYFSMKRETKNQSLSCRAVTLNLSSESKSVEENKLAVAGPDDPRNYEVHDDSSNQEEVPERGSKLANLFKGRLLYSRAWDFLKSASGGRSWPSSFSLHYLT